ncbi:M28 family peptidase [Fulvivirga sp. M361]|uniref:M28 family peptidase n=1 Tax=Fulvivirga sp. M361 TaxID=2594266 RepID=UPI00117A0B1A|nr:M28 family peptidase [Fulvivirga sp. M361]TRX62775.1 M28 family peptidase [Fulvivirga sp. M361]
MKLISKVFCLVLPAVLIISCNTSKEKTVDVDAEEHVITVPLFNKDSAYAFVEYQVSMGPRVPSTTPHVKTGDWLVHKFRTYGAQVEEQNFEATSFDGKKMYLRNIIASYAPEKAKRILLAAHWDTRPFADKDNSRKDEAIDGANDGASGVGVLLEIARSIQQELPKGVGVDIILFDGEDWGNDVSFQKPVPLRDGWESWWCMGSQYWGKNPHKPNYSAYYGILLDMVGGKNARFFTEGYSRQIAPSIVKKVWDVASQIGYSNYFVRREGAAITDDHYFVHKYRNIPMIDIIPMDPESDSFGTFHHTHNDNMDIISKETLGAVGETLLYVLYHE